MTLEEMSVRGWEVLRLSSAELTLDVVPGLGGTVTSLRRADGRELLAGTPWGLPFRGALQTPGGAEATMLDGSPGGWEPLFPNVGHSVDVHHTTWGFDGEARATWLEHRSTSMTLELTGRLRRAPFELQRSFRVDGAVVHLSETVRNVGGEAVEVMWGTRLLLGGDLVGSDTVLDTGATLVRPEPQHSPGAGYEDLLPWPRAYGEAGMVNLRTVPAPGSGFTRVSYLSDFDRPSARVRRPGAGLGLEVEWDTQVWPFLGYAMESGGREGYPWYGAGYHLALTPASSWPLSGVDDARRTSATTLWIEPGDERTSTLTLRLTDGR